MASRLFAGAAAMALALAEQHSGSDKDASDSGPAIEIHFQSLGPFGPGPQELMGTLSGGGEPLFSDPGADPSDPSDALGSLFMAALQMQSRDMQEELDRRQRPRHGSLRMSGTNIATDMGLDDLVLPPTGHIAIATHSVAPISLFGELFPPMMKGGSGMWDAEDDDEDELVSNMMQHLSDSFKQDMLPSLRKASNEGQPPISCAQDLKAFKPPCRSDQPRLECLGQHADKVSDECRKEVGKSVPFLCSEYISEFCDPMREGILPCLANKLPKLDQTCRESVILTHETIIKANSQKVTFRNTTTGEEKTHTPQAKEMPTLLTDFTKKATQTKAAKETAKETVPADAAKKIALAMDAPSQKVTEGSGISSKKKEAALPADAARFSLERSSLRNFVFATLLLLALFLGFWRSGACEPRHKKIPLGEGVLLEAETSAGNVKP